MASSRQRAGRGARGAFGGENSDGRLGGFRSCGFLFGFGFQADDVGHVDQPDGPAFGGDDRQFAEFSLGQERDRVADARAARDGRGLATITSHIGRSSAASSRRSNSRAKSLSVNRPVSRPALSVSMMAPLRRPGFVHFTITSRTDSESLAERHSASGRMMSSTLLSLRPSAPPGWKRAKSSAWKFRILLITSASASPTASMAVVLVLGARPSEQTSSKSPSSMTTLAARPTVLLVRAVIGDKRHAELAQRRQQLRDFGRLAALREHDHDIVRMDATQIAVKRFGRMEEVGAACRSRQAWRRSSDRSGRPCPCR